MVKFLAFLIILVILFGLDTTRSIIGGAFWVIVIIAIVGAIWAFINAVSPKKEDGKKSFTIKKEGEEFDNKEYKS